MNTYNINDNAFLNSKLYQDFLKANPSRGTLKIRAFAASEAIPVEGVFIIVSSNIANNNVIFFKGNTDNSGMIPELSLPAPKLNGNNLDAPSKTIYDIDVNYPASNFKKSYRVNMYENINVLQNINVVPNMQMMGGDF